MEYLIKIKYAEVEIDEDSWEEGELDYVTRYSIDSLEGQEFEDIDSLIKAIADESFIFTADKDDYVYIDGRIDTDATVNADTELPSEEEYEAWKQGKLMLYTAHLFCGLEMVPKGYKHDMTEEEAESFGLYTS